MLRTALLFAPLLAVGCCTDVGCAGFGVFLLDGPLEAGATVAFDVTIGDADGRCAGVVGEPLLCEGRLQAVLDPDDVVTMLQFMSPTPTRRATAEVTVVVDGQFVVDEDIRVNADASRPNGPLCGPTCRSFTHDLVW